MKHLIFVIIGALILSWLMTCGIIKIITLCFGLKFTWLVATGIWFVMLLLRQIFKSDK